MTTTYWLSYGGGRNSTALLILLVTGRLSRYEPWRAVFADTGDEKPETYAYIKDVITPYLECHGRELETVHPIETVLGRWERLVVTGSRRMRGCTVNGKIKPIHQHIQLELATGDEAVQLIGIDAGESHRAKPSDPAHPFQKVYPLCELDIDLDGCKRIIQCAGLPVPPKSGCWHCPFARVGDVLALAREYPEKFATIERLEAASLVAHPIPPEQVAAGAVRAQWHDKPARFWRERAAREGRQERLEFGESEMPCGCFDGEDA